VAGNCHRPNFFLLIRTKIFQTKQAFADLHFVKALDVGGVFNVALVFDVAVIFNVAISLDVREVFNVA
jgi:hypothetical protein